MIHPETPFAVLGIAPTLDVSVVKRAWFAALAAHPPQSDPRGFRKVRDAYEALSGPGRLDVAWAIAPVDIDAELSAVSARVDPALAVARAAAQRSALVEAAARRLIDTCSQLSLHDLTARLNATVSGSPSFSR